MNKLRFVVIALAGVCALAFGVFALATRTTEPPQGGPVIIIKGGSLTIHCDYDVDCLEHTATGEYSHKDKTKKITQIKVIGESGSVLKTFYSNPDFPNGKATIEITYK